MQYTLIHKSSGVQISKELLLQLHYKTAEHVRGGTVKFAKSPPRACRGITVQQPL